jgi:hypothetical protein
MVVVHSSIKGIEMLQPGWRDAYLLQSDHHRIRTDKGFDARFRESGLAHPTLIIGSGVVESAWTIVEAKIFGRPGMSPVRR